MPADHPLGRELPAVGRLARASPAFEGGMRLTHAAGMADFKRCTSINRPSAPQNLGSVFLNDQG